MSGKGNDPYEFTEEYQDKTDNIFSLKANKCARIVKDLKTMTKMEVDPQPESSDMPQSLKTCSVGVETETAYLGPCEPGTSVTLEGVVWHESDTGILVINVTWRGKKYIGTLLDVSQHEWAPPNFNPNNPSSACSAKEKSPIKLRSRRGRGGKRSAPPAPPPVHRSPRKWTSVTTSMAPGSSEPSKSSDDSTSTTSESVVITCNQSNCNKRFKGANSQDAFEYHRAHAHFDVSDSSLNEDKLVIDESDDKGNDITQGIIKSDKPEKIVKNESESKSANVVKDDPKINKSGLSDKNSASMIQSFTNFVQPVDISVKQTESKSIGFSSSNVVNSTHNMKKLNTPVAVLRPLVPQVSSSQVSKLSTSSSSGNTRALNTTGVPPIRGNLPNVPKSSPFFNSGTQMQHFVTSSNNVQINQYPLVVPASQGNRNLNFYQPTMHVAAPVSSRSGGVVDKAQGRNSLTYSDISDASDQEGEVVSNDGRGGSRENTTTSNRECSTIEDRLFCNEELNTSSPPLNSADHQQTMALQNQQQSCSSTTASNTPGKSTMNMNKKNHHGTSLVNNSSSSNNLTQTQSHHVLSTQQQHHQQHHQPPQAMMYPYIPFMQNAPMQGNLPFQPTTGPMYASPYLMTYPGMPQFMPAQQMGNVPNPNQQFQVLPVTSESNAPTSKTN